MAKLKKEYNWTERNLFTLLWRLVENNILSQRINSLYVSVVDMTGRLSITFPSPPYTMFQKNSGVLFQSKSFYQSYWVPMRFSLHNYTMLISSYTLFENNGFLL